MRNHRNVVKSYSHVNENTRQFLYAAKAGDTSGMTNEDIMAYNLALKMARVKQAVRDKAANLKEVLVDYRRSLASLVNGRSVSRLLGRMAGHSRIHGILARIRHLALSIICLFAPHKGNEATVRIYA